MAVPSSNPAQKSWMDIIKKGKSVGYNGVLNGKKTRVSYQGRVMDTDNSSWINEILGKGGSVIKSNAMGKAPQNMNLQRLSIAALSGDMNAQNFLKQMNINAATGSSLWKGITGQQLDAGNQSMRAAYNQQNPYSDYTKKYDMNSYNSLSDSIKNNKQIPDYQREAYDNVVNKWGLQDMNDPLVQYQEKLKQNEQESLNAEDVQLNQGMGQMDANNFQQFQQLQQQMSERGMADSGIAADSYMRAQMGANQNYQSAFAESTGRKADIKQSYAEAINQAKVDSRDYTDKRNDAFAEQQAANDANQIKLLEQQTEQDKYLTSSTGYVYMNGKPLTMNGKPLTSLEYKKLNETQRHNMASENNIAIGNAQDYELGTDRNDIARMKVQADIDKASASLKLGYDKLDQNWEIAQANIDKAMAGYDIAARNAATSEQSNAIKAVNSKISALKGQIKNGKPTKAQKKALGKLMEEMDNVIGATDF